MFASYCFPLLLQELKLTVFCQTTAPKVPTGGEYGTTSLGMRSSKGDRAAAVEGDAGTNGGDSGTADGCAVRGDDAEVGGSGGGTGAGDVETEDNGQGQRRRFGGCENTAPLLSGVHRSGIVESRARFAIPEIR